jgi:hypothetical protein
VTTGHQLPGVDDLLAQFGQFRYSAFRLETLQTYAASSEDESYAAFQRGEPERPQDPEEVAWSAMLRANREAGRIQQRVHVVTEPLTDYMAYELTWEYGPHWTAGEDIRIIPAGDTWPSDVPRADFWLFDARLIFRLHYASDGTWLGVDREDAPAAVADACFIRDAALSQAVLWDRYMQRHPTLIRRLPREDACRDG